MATAGPSLLSRISVVIYWVVLTPLLLFSVLLSWDALPEGSVPRALRWVILGTVVVAVSLTWKRRVWHATAVSLLLGGGLLLFMIDQGIINEPPHAADARILRRTKELLAREDAWDRSPSRDCTAGSPKLTLYCALHEASLQETGSFRHRRPALQIVREEIELFRPHANYDHRLSGFNADPSVTFSALNRLLDASIARVNSDLARHGARR